MNDCDVCDFIEDIMAMAAEEGVPPFILAKHFLIAGIAAWNIEDSPMISLAMIEQIEAFCARERERRIEAIKAGEVLPEVQSGAVH